jgi:transposase
MEDFPCSVPGSPLTHAEIFLIGYYAAKRFSSYRIGSMLNRDASTISRIVTKFQPPSSSYTYPHKHGAKNPTIPSLPLIDQSQVPEVTMPQITKLFLRHYLIYMILKDSAISLRTISHIMIEKKFPFAIGKTQIGVELRTLHIRSIRAIQRPRMTLMNREYRKEFAEAIQTDFRILLPWLFTDEASITRDTTSLQVKRIPGIIDNDHIYNEKEQFPMRIMVWGAIAHNFKSPLIRVEGNVNADKYKQIILQSNVINSMDSIYGKKAWVFQDDGASAHRAKKAREFLAKECFTLSSELHWPAHSPDLSVIENLWGVLKTRITVSNCKTPDDIWLQAQAAWDEISIEEVNNLIDSFTSRLRTVEALDGQSLNGHRNVQVMLTRGYTTEQIRQMRTEEQKILKKFLDESEHLFETEVWEETKLNELFDRCKTILRKLPERILQKVNIRIPPDLINTDLEI